jgi:hypothetical protein
MGNAVIAIAGLLVLVQACIAVFVRRLRVRRRLSRTLSQRPGARAVFPGNLPARDRSINVSSWLSPLASGSTCPAREVVRKFE